MKTNKLSARVMAVLLTLVMVLSMVPVMAFASENSQPDQKGTVKVTMLHEKQDKPSMCDVMFAEKADVEIHGDEATLKIYVAYPVPAFPEMGKDGTVKNFTVTYGGQTYIAASDLESQPTMIVKSSNPGFGLVAGDEIPAQVLTLTLPKAALEETELPATALVNVIMGMNVNFRMSLKDLTLEDTKPVPEPDPEPEPEPEPQPQPDTPADQKGTVKVTMLHEKQDKPSMCDVMFAEKADVEIRGDEATLKLYVAYPVPAFPEMGKDGTIKDFTVTYGGQTYTAASDLESKPTMIVKSSNPGFGLVAGEEIPAQVLTLTLPKAALEETELPATAFVNVIMGMNVNFRMSLKDLTLEDTKPEPEPEPEPQPDTPADQKGTVKVTMLHEKQDKPSMCDVMFAEKADVEIRGDEATLKLYVAYPVPAFPEMGKDGTVKDFAVTYGGQTYTATSDLESQPTMVVKSSNPGFGLVAGDEIPAQVLTLTLPKAALEETELPVTALVNVIMGMNVNFRMSLKDLVLEDTKPEPEPDPDPKPEPPKPAHPAADLKDEATGICIHADKNVFLETVNLVVKHIGSEEEAYTDAAKILQSVGEKFELYDIYFVNDNGEKVQPNGKVTVSYPVLEGYDASKLALYRINEDGTKTKINGTLADGYYTVTQRSFSTYALVETGSKVTEPTVPETTVPEKDPTVPEKPVTPDSEIPQTGDGMHMFALLSAMLVSCAAIVLLTLGKKHRSVN